jgi:hypothetical protein
MVKRRRSLRGGSGAAGYATKTVGDMHTQLKNALGGQHGNTLKAIKGGRSRRKRQGKSKRKRSTRRR